MSALLPSDSALGGSPTETPPMTDRMQMGREVDALVAEKVMGWCWLYRFGHRWFGPPETVGETHPVYGMVWAWDAETFPDAEREDAWWLRDVAPDADSPVVPHYSTDIGAAWEIIGTLHGNTDKWWRFHNALVSKVLPSFGATGLHELESSVAAWAVCLAVASSSHETPE